MTPQGVLYVVATPIGNLEDLTPRAARALAEADLVAAEDTRRTRGLLAHLGLKKRLVSYREHNRRTAGPRLLEALAQGQTVALVTDAGTPGLSDPGPELVASARAAGIRVSAVPGPSAVTAALSVSGFPADRFLFAGFLPARASARRKRLQELAGVRETLVLFEAPHRLAASLADLATGFGPERPALLARELTKVNEEMIFGGLGELAALGGRRDFKGEAVLVVAGGGQEKTTITEADQAGLRAGWIAARRQGLSATQAAKALAGEFGLPRRRVYQQGLAWEKKESSS